MEIAFDWEQNAGYLVSIEHFKPSVIRISKFILSYHCLLVGIIMKIRQSYLLNYQPSLSTVIKVEIFLFARNSNEDVDILSESAVSGRPFTPDFKS